MVLRAFDNLLMREVAIKLAHRALLDQAVVSERFVREAKAAALLRHPNIVPVYDAGTWEGRPFIAFAFVDGRTLRAVLDAGEVPTRQAVCWMRDLAAAVHYAHDAGVIHRDIKPSNVMIDRNGEVLLTDFGVARLEQDGSGGKQTGPLGGTPAYMSPELAAGDETAGALSDQFALGAMLYEILAGQPPFTGSATEVAYQLIHKTPTAPRALQPNIPRDLEAICMRALDRIPEQRYPDCQSLADELQRWLDGREVMARLPKLPEQLTRWAKRSPILAGSSCMLVILIILSLAAMAQLRRVQFALRKAIVSAEQQTHVAAQRKRDADAAARELENARGKARRSEATAVRNRKRATENELRARDALQRLSIAKSTNQELEQENSTRLMELLRNKELLARQVEVSKSENTIESALYNSGVYTSAGLAKSAGPSFLEEHGITSEQIISELCGANPSKTLRDQVQYEISRIEQQYRRYRRGHIVMGRIRWEGEEDVPTHSIHRVLAQMRVLEKGFFLDLADAPGKPIGFRLWGYETTEVVPLGPGPIEHLGEIHMRPMAENTSAHFSGHVTGSWPAAATEGRPMLVVANVRLGPINRPGEEELPYGLWHVTHISENGSFFFRNIVPGRYSLFVTRIDPRGMAYVVMSPRQSVDVSGSETIEVPPLEAFALKQIRFEYAFSQSGRFEKRPVLEAIVEAGEKWNVENRDLRRGEHDLQVNQEIDKLVLTSGQDDFLIADLGEASLEERKAVRSTDVDQEAMSVDMLLQNGHVYLFHQERFKRWVLLRTSWDES